MALRDGSTSVEELRALHHPQHGRVFADLPEDFLVWLISIGNVREGDDGDVFVEPNQPADEMSVILEHADRVNDSTHVLRTILGRTNGVRVAVPYLWDPKGAAEIVKAGVGATITVAIGGRSSDRAGGPVTLEGKVLFAGEKTYRTTGPMGRGNHVNLGPTGVIDTGDVVVWVTSTQKTAIDEDCFLQFGMKASDFGVIVLRSKTHFRAVYEPLAEEILIVDTPDWGPADLTTLPFRLVPTDRVFPFVDLD